MAGRKTEMREYKGISIGRRKKGRKFKICAREERRPSDGTCRKGEGDGNNSVLR